VTRKAPSRKRAAAGPRGGGPDRRSERPGAATKKVGKKPGGARSPRR
jgi:hypothetical protein